MIEIGVYNVLFRRRLSVSLPPLQSPNLPAPWLYARRWIFDGWLQRGIPPNDKIGKRRGSRENLVWEDARSSTTSPVRVNNQLKQSVEGGTYAGVRGGSS